MRMSAKKPEEKRLDWLAQTGVDQAKTRITPAFEVRNRAQVALQMLDQRRSPPKRVDRSANLQQLGKSGVLLGECRLINILNADFRRKAQ